MPEYTCLISDVHKIPIKFINSGHIEKMWRNLNILQIEECYLLSPFFNLANAIT